MYQGLRCHSGDVLGFNFGSAPVGVVAKQFVHFNDATFVLGHACEQVAVRSASCSVWRAVGEMSFHPLVRLVTRRTWAPLTGSDMLVLNSGV